jgi:hypothetical protein
MREFHPGSAGRVVADGAGVPDGITAGLAYLRRSHCDVQDRAIRWRPGRWSDVGMGPLARHRDDLDYILGTFPIVNRKVRERFGKERIRRLLLENHDRTADAVRSGEPFVSTLDPPPRHGPRHPAW